MSSYIRLYIKRNYKIKKIEFLIQSFLFYFSLLNASLKWSNKWLTKSSRFL